MRFLALFVTDLPKTVLKERSCDYRMVLMPLSQEEQRPSGYELHPIVLFICCGKALLNFIRRDLDGRWGTCSVCYSGFLKIAL